MSTIIAPALLAETEDNYKEQAARLHEFAARVHIDVCDGEFAPTFTVPADKLWWAQDWTVDIHAMVARPSEFVQLLVSLKPSLIIFHAEVKEDLLPVIKYVQKYGCKAGVGLLQGTVPNTVSSLIEAADHVMIFSGDLGHIGGTASLMQLEKVRLIRAIKQDVEIGWDGGVNVENAFSLAQGGVDVLNVGGAIAKSADPAQAYATLVSEINKHGAI
jgi:ribulose-phosphate 3-epimerase